MNRYLHIALGVALATAGFGCQNNHADTACACKAEHHHDDDEQTIDVSAVPAAVTAGVTTAMPDAKITGAEKEIKDGKTVYELDVTSQNKKYEVKVGEDGKVISSKEEKDDDEKGEKKD